MQEQTATTCTAGKQSKNKQATTCTDRQTNKQQFKQRTWTYLPYTYLTPHYAAHSIEIAVAVGYHTNLDVVGIVVVLLVGVVAVAGVVAAAAAPAAHSVLLLVRELLGVLRLVALQPAVLVHVALGCLLESRLHNVGSNWGLLEVVVVQACKSITLVRDPNSVVVVAVAVPVAVAGCNLLLALCTVSPGWLCFS